MEATHYIETGYSQVPLKKVSSLVVGDKFEIIHSDGYIAKETIAKIDSDKSGKFFFVCESCAVYYDYEIENNAKAII